MRGDGRARDWDERADELSARAIADGVPTTWFDELYAEGEAGTVSMPWSRTDPHPLVEQWVREHAADGSGRRAVVVGCGLGADAEFLAGLGYAVTAFDVAPTAVRVARERHPGSPVEYAVADLLDLPAEWRQAFDLVVEVFTLQALPDPPRGAAGAAVASLVAPGGHLLVVQFRAVEGSRLDQGPPFPQPRALFDALATDGLALSSLEELAAPQAYWRGVLVRRALGEDAGHGPSHHR